MTLIGLKRSHDLFNLPCSFQLNCLHQVVLFIKRQEYSLIKVLQFGLWDVDVQFFIKLAMQGGEKPQN